jgi:hypothetical protein
MSFQSAIPWRVALQQSLPPLYRPVTILNNPLCRTIIFQHTATTPLTSCLSPRVHSKYHLCHWYPPDCCATGPIARKPRPLCLHRLRSRSKPSRPKCRQCSSPLPRPGWSPRTPSRLTRRPGSQQLLRSRRHRQGFCPSPRGGSFAMSVRLVVKNSLPASASPYRLLDDRGSEVA